MLFGILGAIIGGPASGPFAAVQPLRPNRGDTVVSARYIPLIAPVRDFGSCKTAPRLPTLLSKVMACRKNRF
jgi:hypothetical protein